MFIIFYGCKINTYYCNNGNILYVLQHILNFVY